VLAKIAEQLENGLTYDHIGIAILDYTTRELHIQAEGASAGAPDFVFLWTPASSARSRTGKAPRSVPSQLSEWPRPVLAIPLPPWPCDLLRRLLHGVLYVETVTASNSPRKNRSSSAPSPT